MSFSPEQLDEILIEMKRATASASKLLLEGLGQPAHIEYKGAVDLVSQYDLRAEEIVREVLEKSFPDIGMLAEESAGKGDEGTDTKWIVDPLDGTTNYLHGQPLFAVSIGLEELGSIVAGVVAVPALGITVWARRGGGTFANGERATVSKNLVLDKSLVATGFPYDRRDSDDDNSKEFRAFMKRSQGVRRCGAAALDLAFVARGVYDGFWEPKLHAWDLAAGVLLVSEAGGLVTDYSGDPIDIYRGYVVASNGHIHQEMIGVLSGISKGHAKIS